MGIMNVERQFLRPRTFCAGPVDLYRLYDAAILNQLDMVIRKTAVD